MLYCFATASLSGLPDDDLRLQAAYARQLGVCVLLDVARGQISDPLGRAVSIKGRRVLLRADCENRARGMLLVTQNGGRLVEGAVHLQKILHWPHYFQPRRPMGILSAGALVMALIGQGIPLPSGPIFVKSLQKGFARRAAGTQAARRALAIAIAQHDRGRHGPFLYARWQPLMRDAFGPVEARFFVLDGRLQSASRYLHSVCPWVDGRLVRKAARVAGALAANGFPKSYALDIGLFIEPHGPQCYVGNSIFPAAQGLWGRIQQRTGFGAEFCHDLLLGRNTYRLHPILNERYRYSRPSLSLRHDTHHG